MLSIILIPWRGQTSKTSAFQNSLRRFVFLYHLVVGNQLIVSPTHHNNFFKKVTINSFISKASHFSVCVIDCCPPRAEVFEKNVFRGLEHQILVVDGIVRIQAVVGSVRKRRTNWVHIKYLKTSLTHSPGGVSVVQLYPLEGVNLKREFPSYLTMLPGTFIQLIIYFQCSHYIDLHSLEERNTTVKRLCLYGSWKG